MVDPEPSREQKDTLGSTVHIEETIGTGETTIPASPGFDISEFMVVGGHQNAAFFIWVSVDGGTKWIPIGNSGHIHWSLKGGIKQIKIKGDVAALKAYGFINFEPY